MPQGKPEGFHRNLRNLNRACVTFNPLSASLVKGGGLPQGKPEGFHRNLRNLNRACVTFNPSVRSWTRVQLPFQGSLNNPSVCSRCSQPAPDGRESPLSLRDISPHCGESPYLREPKSPLFLPENTVKMFKTVFNTCQKVQNSKTLTICS